MSKRSVRPEFLRGVRTIEEVGDILGIGSGTAKCYLRRGMAKIRKQLQARMAADPVFREAMKEYGI